MSHGEWADAQLDEECPRAEGNHEPVVSRKRKAVSKQEQEEVDARLSEASGTGSLEHVVGQVAHQPS
jgi:hypothetical protein